MGGPILDHDADAAARPGNHFGAQFDLADDSWLEGWELPSVAEKGCTSRLLALLIDFLGARPKVVAAMRMDQLAEHDRDTAVDLDHVHASFLVVVRRGDAVGIARFLGAGWPVNWRDGRGRNPLSTLLRARPPGASRAIDLLLRAGADVHRADIYGRRPIDECLSKYAALPDEQVPMLRALFGHGSLPAKAGAHRAPAMHKSELP